MAKFKATGPLKYFSNVEAVFAKLLELGFFVNSDQRDEELAKITDETFAPHRSNEYWYSNGHVEVKIFKQMFGSYELWNYRNMVHEELDELFELASLSLNGKPR